MNNSPGVALICAVIGCGLVGGVFFAFSTFVMPALSRLSAAQGIAAMQSINVTAINPLFMTALFGTGAVCLFLGGHAIRSWQRPGAAYILGGAVLYVAGVVIVTLAANVPRNNALASASPSSAQAAALWGEYLRTWTALNHVRTITALAAAISFVVALRPGG